MPSKAYWKRIREICDKHNVMLIIDDIPNGMGRSGEWFTYQAYDIEPDMLCIGKGLGGATGAYRSHGNQRQIQHRRANLDGTLHS